MASQIPVDTTELIAFLAGCPPFDSLEPAKLELAVSAAHVVRYPPGVVIVDAFTKPVDEVFVVIAGTVHLWNRIDAVGEPPDERLGRQSVFGYSALLTQRRVGPRVVAANEVTVVALPGSAVEDAFASPEGARFLATSLSASGSHSREPATYLLVDDLLEGDPLIADPHADLRSVTSLMSDGGYRYAAVRFSDDTFGVITDAGLRRMVGSGVDLVAASCGTVAQRDLPVVPLGTSAAEALILMLDRGADAVLVTGPAGVLHGVTDARDFLLSATTAGVSLHEQLRRAPSVIELQRLSRLAPAILRDLMSRGLASSKVIAVHSAVVDTVVRRAIGLVFAEHPDLDPDAFTWMSLGSNGRREAVLSSDVDSAVAFHDHVTAHDIGEYRTVFAEITSVLAHSGFSSDVHGVSAAHQLFARTNSAWRTAGQQWLADPTERNGALMTSLLVDGRPIFGDPGLPAVTAVFGELRAHPAAMGLLLQDSLAKRARLRSVRTLLSRRGDEFDVKEHALAPIINLARWAALSVGSAVLPTIDRLRAAAGSEILPMDQAKTLIEVFEVLQRLRLRYQFRQIDEGDRPSDVVKIEQLSGIDRSIVSQAVREIAAVQRRADNMAQFATPDTWLLPEGRT